ncbi:cadherin-like and PC-esterase domain-containing protein 1 [Trichonephila clavata]|uniref:Cadherin-like and PC-esterase domain-containing protein 1 n=1 Tax=Trichonephila clavata TaxID=2740835 RepID=A0A8X6GBV2_TRICU|nr:cadherin-like and PC-esterase domain-containing protein 1 [Trichonephila clavata]
MISDNLKPQVNRIPGIRNVLWQKDSLCTTTNAAKKIPSLMNSQPAPPCFVLPVQYQEFVNVAEALGYTSQWLLKPLTAISGPRLVDIFSPVGQAEIDEFSRRRAVAQQLVNNPFTVFGQPVSIRLYVLVTSMLPLRAYVHSQGIVYHRYNESKNFKKIPGRTWPLSQFWQYVSKNYGFDAVTSAIHHVHQTIVHMLLLAELSMMAAPSDDIVSGLGRRFKCAHCFQLLGVDVMMNSSLRASIVEVNGQPSVQESTRDEELFINSVKEAVVEDTVALLLSPTAVAKQLAKAIAHVAVDHNMGILGVNCRVSHDLCLSHQDLLFLLQSRRETLNSGGFRQLYPSVQGDIYGPVVDEIQEYLNEQMKSNGENVTSPYKTAHLRQLVMNLEKFYGPQNSYENYVKEDMKLGGCCRKSNFSEPVKHWNFGRFSDSKEPFLPSCSDDPTTMPYLSGISVYPHLILTPSFNPLVTDYSANVSYEQLMVSLSAQAQNCQTEVRIDDKYGPTRTTNYTLGVGENRISFLVVDITHTEPWVINTYTLVVHRLTITHGEPPFDPSIPHQVCSLHQECEMRVSPTELCGIQRDAGISRDWVSYSEEVANLPICKLGDAPGRWVLPCLSCGERNSCFWREAVWHPYGCRHAVLSTETLKQCLAGKKLLFIGDSTNRGMMHYVIERLNGSLNEWDKTHDIRVYKNVNDGRTVVSFAYYPQFWLPTNQRPVFDKALYHLIQKSRPLKNNSNTVLIVGGVQWLATQHLLMMLRALRVERLQGIKLVMKTLGAGFHLPVEGVHTLSMDEQRKLLLHSMGLADFAKHYNFEVIDTFNITVPRYKDFLQGKCACHFHRVVKIPSLDDNFPRWRTRRNTGTGGSRQTRFHVEGPINAIYSEILLSRICSDFYLDT